MCPRFAACSKTMRDLRRSSSRPSAVPDPAHRPRERPGDRRWGTPSAPGRARRPVPPGPRRDNRWSRTAGPPRRRMSRSPRRSSSPSTHRWPRPPPRGTGRRVAGQQQPDHAALRRLASASAPSSETKAHPREPAVLHPVGSTATGSSSSSWAWRAQYSEV